MLRWQRSSAPMSSSCTRLPAFSSCGSSPMCRLGVAAKTPRHSQRRCMPIWRTDAVACCISCEHSPRTTTVSPCIIPSSLQRPAAAGATTSPRWQRDWRSCCPRRTAIRCPRAPSVEARIAKAARTPRRTPPTVLTTRRTTTAVLRCPIATPIAAQASRAGTRWSTHAGSPAPRALLTRTGEPVAHRPPSASTTCACGVADRRGWRG
mmetsp:Transcript_134297/g.388757  ORF Transcript_134297/g.388757 Transcript_134297/m.388757 type:complete len:207 (-) Transcript_134297:473-1093(-)